MLHTRRSRKTIVSYRQILSYDTPPTSYVSQFRDSLPPLITARLSGDSGFRKNVRGWFSPTFFHPPAAGGDHRRRFLGDRPERDQEGLGYPNEGFFVELIPRQPRIIGGCPGTARSNKRHDRKTVIPSIIIFIPSGVIEIVRN